MKETKPICSLSLDLDNQWSYMKTHGDAGWESFPSYLDLVVPRFLKILDDFGWKITVFVVGQDAALEKNREALQMIAAAGHEIGNHSFNHEPWLAPLLEAAGRRRDHPCRGGHRSGNRPTPPRIPRTGLQPVSRTSSRFSPTATTCTTRRRSRPSSGPLARAYYFMTSDFSTEEKRFSESHVRRPRDGLRPIRPYLWQLDQRTILEIPVTTLPLLKLPIHFSYLLFISTFSKKLAFQYFRLALVLCQIAKSQPSLLLHPLDFLCSDDVPELDFFPAMKVGLAHKLSFVRESLALLSQRQTVLGIAEYAETLGDTSEFATSPKKRSKLSVRDDL